MDKSMWKMLRLQMALAAISLFATGIPKDAHPHTNPLEQCMRASVTADPAVLNLKSKGKWLTLYIELPQGKNLQKIDINTLSLFVNGFYVGGVDPWAPSRIGDHDKDGIPDLMVKFDRDLVQSATFLGPVELTVTGSFVGSSTLFRGSDRIKAVLPNDRDILRLTVLQTSDIHHHASGSGPFLDYTPLNPTDADEVLGGYARLAKIIGRVRAEQAAKGIPVLLLDSGDFFMGTVYDLTAADPIGLRFLTMMGYDAVTLGNHEFDWSAAGLAMLLSNGISNGFNVPVVATNMVTSTDSAADDGIEALIKAGAIVDRKVMELPNGLKLGILGSLGRDADTEAPVALPITFDHSAGLIQGYVDELKDEYGANLVILMSHGGIEMDGTGEDADLAGEVTGLNIIASGHFHTATPKAFVKGGTRTIIFSPGAYGERLSRLDISYDKRLSRIVDYRFSLIRVDDTVKGDPAVQEFVEAYNEAIDMGLTPLNLQLAKPISKTDFPLVEAAFQETGLGNLVADSLRGAANAIATMTNGDGFDVGVVASGVIKAALIPGKTGTLTFADIYSVTPLGISPDPSQPVPGYPLMSVYLNAQDLRTTCEVALTLSPYFGSDYYLNFSGIRIDYNPALAQYFQGVQEVHLCAPGDISCTGDCPRINLSDNTRLFHVVVDLYALQMMGIVNAMLPDGLSIVPRDVSGNPIHPETTMAYRIDADPEANGVQELKEWMALLTFLGLYFPYDSGIPEDVYGLGGSALGRVQFLTDPDFD